MPDQIPPDADLALSDIIPNAADPGGAHKKGYSADPEPGIPAPDNDPVPLADDREVHGHVQKRDEDTVLPPTGRSGPPEYSPDDRTIGNGL
jgi:hypothetical protein